MLNDDHVINNEYQIKENDFTVACEKIMTVFFSDKAEVLQCPRLILLILLLLYLLDPLKLVFRSCQKERRIILIE